MKERKISYIKHIHLHERKKREKGEMERAENG
jgi:hypothetical protein